MTVTTNGDTFTEQEIAAYKKHIEEKFPCSEIVSLTLEVDPDDPTYVNMSYELKNKPECNVPFDRIRRITGYLGTLPRINNSKRNEIKDRLTHN
jgi:hypothetical protein